MKIGADLGTLSWSGVPPPPKMKIWAVGLEIVCEDLSLYPPWIPSRSDRAVCVGLAGCQ